jgi:uncharacterized membrane protein
MLIAAAPTARLCQTAAVTTSRLEAFSDGVLAIIITIMVLELHVPEGTDLEALGESATGFLTYLLSFVYVGIYWNNHHHMFKLVQQIDGLVLWSNMHLLFWLSLFPDESQFARTPTVTYGLNLLAAAIAYYLTQLAVFRTEGPESPLRRAVGRDVKGKISPVLYLTGIAAAWLSPWLSLAIFTAVAVMWVVPDRRLERFVAEHASER